MPVILVFVVHYRTLGLVVLGPQKGSIEDSLNCVKIVLKIRLHSLKLIHNLH